MPYFKLVKHFVLVNINVKMNTFFEKYLVSTSSCTTFAPLQTLPKWKCNFINQVNLITVHCYQNGLWPE
jgi:glyceraldehyde-3-phosphate dehydrogenase/erythrose-4-phosphate dehydrogenase